mgnify:CR=1 FL=1
MDRKLVVVADDFTGSNDTGVQFSKTGLTTNVITEPRNLHVELQNADVIVVDLESRFDTQADAYQKCFDVGAQLKKEAVTVYKKLDSTFRGNIGAEIEGLMKGLGLKKAILAAALPSNGRKTIQGKVVVHGIPLAETEFATDPRTPIHSSCIQKILEEQMKLSTVKMRSDWTKLSAEERAKTLNVELQKETGILIFDGESETDLIVIAEQIQAVQESILIVGTAGLANHLPKAWSLEPKRKTFVFAGSVSERTRVQVARAEAHMDLTRFDILGTEILKDEVGFFKKIKQDVANAWEAGESRFVFATTRSRNEVDQVFEMAKKIGITNGEAAEKIALWIGRLSAECIRQYQPTGIFLTGGDTAIKTVMALGGSGIQIHQEVLPGIPSGVLTGCGIEGIVVTKAGGFGDEEAVCRVIEFLEA